MQIKMNMNELYPAAAVGVALAVGTLLSGETTALQSAAIGVGCVAVRAIGQLLGFWIAAGVGIGVVGACVDSPKMKSAWEDGQYHKIAQGIVSGALIGGSLGYVAEIVHRYIPFGLAFNLGR